MVSNEPELHDIDAGFGIRIENLLVIGPKATAHSFNSREYLGFDPLTMVPIQQSLIEPSLLTDVEANWLDSYHARVWDSVSPLHGGGIRGLCVAQGAHKAARPKGAGGGGCRAGGRGGGGVSNPKCTLYCLGYAGHCDASPSSPSPQPRTPFER